MKIYLILLMFVATLLIVYTYHNIKLLFKEFKTKKHMILWRIIIITISSLIIVFTYYLSTSLLAYYIEGILKNIAIACFVISIITLIFIDITSRIFDDVKVKHEKLLNLNFVLDNEAREKANFFADKSKDLELTNNQLSNQTEILAEKEKELKNINNELVNAQNQLKIEKESIESKVVERTKELRDEKEKVEALLNQKNEFINQLSHDLRTPLTPLTNLLPMLKENLKTADDKKIVDICIKNTSYLEKLVLSTLNLARLGSKKVELSLTDNNIKSLIDEIISLNQSGYKKSNFVIENKIDKKLVLECDKMRIREVFENIISNAIKYNENKIKKLTITSKISKNNAELIFTDNGIGIEPKYLNKLGTEFYKVDPSRHQHESSGLGISIIKRIIEMHKGTFIITSKGLKKGTTIIINIPIKQ